MTIPRPPIRLPLLLALATVAAQAQTPAPIQTPAAPVAVPVPVPHKPRPRLSATPINPNLILLDPAHGGPDTGARLADDAEEKDATIAFAEKLKALLSARGFTVLLTHDSAADNPPPDQRAEIANRSHAAACILLHAANGGHGVHLFTSALAPTTTLDTSQQDPTVPRPILPWGTAQAALLPQSLQLSGALSDALYNIRVPLVVGRVSVSPIDSLSCPAIAVELAPLAPAQDSGDDPTSPADDAYQNRIANALVTALNNWRGHLQTLANAAAAQATAAAPTAENPRPKPAKVPTPKSIPVETPDLVPNAAHPAAPIIRRPPPTPPPASPPQ